MTAVAVYNVSHQKEVIGRMPKCLTVLCIEILKITTTQYDYQYQCTEFKTVTLLVLCMTRMQCVSRLPRRQVKAPGYKCRGIYVACTLVKLHSKKHFVQQILLYPTACTRYPEFFCHLSQGSKQGLYRISKSTSQLINNLPS